MNDIMQFMHELKELVHKGEEIAQQMHGGDYGQRRYGHYGMRDSQSYGGYGGGYGQRWEEQPMHGQYPPMHGGQQHWQDINPMMFM